MGERFESEISKRESVYVSASEIVFMWCAWLRESVLVFERL